MERLVRCVLSKYDDYLLAAKIQEQILQTTHDDERMKSLKVLEMKITVINHWLSLLNDVERFVVQRHLINQLGWVEVTVEFNSRWGGQMDKSEHTLKKYQEKALKRIVDFSYQHRDLINELFIEGSGDIQIKL